MLKGEACAVDLPRLGSTAKLMDELIALGEACRSERMAFREQAAGRVGDVTPAIRVIAVEDELLCLTLAAEAERLVGDELVLRKAIVQFDDIDILRRDAIWRVRASIAPGRSPARTIWP